MAASDFDFFSARPDLDSRTRLPFDGEFEFSPDVMEQGLAAFVRVIVERDAAGRPKRRALALLFCDGGTA